MDDEVVWSGLGTAFQEGVVYEAIIPKDLLSGKSGYFAFTLHSVGEVNADVTIGDMETEIFSEEPPFQFGGFFPPVDNLPIVNTTKAGAAVPLKFTLGGDQGLNVFALGAPASRQIACESATVLSEVEQTLTAGQSSLVYDPALDQYTYVWKTDKKWVGTCRELSVSFVDGQTFLTRFRFAK